MLLPHNMPWLSTICWVASAFFFYGLQPDCPFHWPLTSTRRFFSTQLQLSGYVLILGTFPRKPGDGCHVVNIPIDQQLVRYSDQPFWLQPATISHSKVGEILRLVHFWCSCWTSASRRHHIVVPTRSDLLTWLHGTWLSHATTPWSEVTSDSANPWTHSFANKHHQGQKGPRGNLPQTGGD